MILSGKGGLPATFARDGEPLESRRIYIAPPGRHLIVEANRVWLGSGPRENRSRPAIDPMLRSVAVCCCGRATGVILTGALGDGAGGLAAMAQCSGITVVQDPSDAMFREMPTTALDRVKPDHIVPLADMPALLEKLVRQPAGPTMQPAWNLKYEVEIAKGRAMNIEDMDRLGRRSPLTCPDCGGVMWEISDGDLTRYRCHVGHACSIELMRLALDEQLRRAIAVVLRSFDERSAVAKRLAADARNTGRSRNADRWQSEAQEFEQQAKSLRESVRRIDDMILSIESHQGPVSVVGPGA